MGRLYLSQKKVKEKEEKVITRGILRYWFVKKDVEELKRVMQDESISYPLRLAALKYLGDLEDVDSILIAFRSPDPIIRKAAIPCLGALKRTSELVEATEDKDSGIRAAAVEELAFLYERDKLFEIFKKTLIPDVRAEALKAFRDLEFLKGLLAGAEHTDKSLREKALNYLADIKKWGKLEDLLKSKFFDVRMKAVSLFKRFALEFPDALDGLVKAIENDNPKVRRSALNHLLLISFKGKTKRVAKIWKETKFKDIKERIDDWREWRKKKSRIVNAFLKRFFGKHSYRVKLHEASPEKMLVKIFQKTFKMKKPDWTKSYGAAFRRAAEEVLEDYGLVGSKAEERIRRVLLEKGLKPAETEAKKILSEIDTLVTTIETRGVYLFNEYYIKGILVDKKVITREEAKEIAKTERIQTKFEELLGWFKEIADKIKLIVEEEGEPTKFLVPGDRVDAGIKKTKRGTVAGVDEKGIIHVYFDDETPEIAFVKPRKKPALKGRYIYFPEGLVPPGLGTIIPGTAPIKKSDYFRVERVGYVQYKDERKAREWALELKKVLEDGVQKLAPVYEAGKELKETIRLFPWKEDIERIIADLKDPRSAVRRDAILRFKELWQKKKPKEEKWPELQRLWASEIFDEGFYESMEAYKKGERRVEVPTVADESIKKLIKRLKDGITLPLKPHLKPYKKLVDAVIAEIKKVDDAISALPELSATEEAEREEVKEWESFHKALRELVHLVEDAPFPEPEEAEFDKMVGKILKKWYWPGVRWLVLRDHRGAPFGAPVVKDFSWPVATPVDWMTPVLIDDIRSREPQGKSREAIESARKDPGLAKLPPGLLERRFGSSDMIRRIVSKFLGNRGWLS